MHIAEGVLSAPVLITGAVVAAAGVAYGLKKIQANHFMLAGLLGAAFFVASLIHVPIGFSSAHLILNGFLGVVLGWAAFPVILWLYSYKLSCSSSEDLPYSASTPPLWVSERWRHTGSFML